LNSYKHKYETIKNKNAINKSYGYVSNAMKMKTKTKKCDLKQLKLPVELGF
jgi:hypothetical protein